MLAVVVLLITRAPAGAQSVSTALPDAPDRSIKLLREDEDWSFLANPANRQDFWDPVKYIRLRSGNNDWFMTISGEAREVWEQIGNDYWGQAPYWNGYLNERYMLGFDIHYGKHVRTFVDLKSGINSFRYGGPRPIDEKKLDFQAAFLQVGTAEGRELHPAEGRSTGTRVWVWTADRRPRGTECPPEFCRFHGQQQNR